MYVKDLNCRHAKYLLENMIEVFTPFNIVNLIHPRSTVINGPATMINRIVICISYTIKNKSNKT